MLQKYGSQKLAATIMTDSVFSSPARSIGDRSIGDPNSLTDSEITESESEAFEFATEVPGSPEQTIVDGWVKFRDHRKVCSITVADVWEG